MSRLVAFVAFLAVTAYAPTGARASLVTYMGTPDPIIAGQTGQLEVFLTNTAPGPAATAVQYQVGLDIVAPGDPSAPFEASFTGAVPTITGTTEPYLFQPSFGVQVVSYDNADPTKFAYGDFSGSPGSPSPIDPGDIFSLGYVSFTGTTPGTYTVNFTGASIDTGPISTLGGSSITILPAAVPEPSTTLLLGLTGLVGFAASRVRRKRRRESRIALADAD